MGGREPGGVPQTSGLQGLGALPGGFCGEAVVHVSRRMKSDPAVPMIMVVVVHEFGHELPGGLQGAEPFREHRRVFQRLVPRLAKRVVVGNPWPGMGSGHTKIIEQGRDGFAGHRGAAVGVHDLGDALNPEHLRHQIDCQRGGFGVVRVGANDHPGVDVDHHVAIEILPLDRAGQLARYPSYTPDGVPSPATRGSTAAGVSPADACP